MDTRADFQRLLEDMDKVIQTKRQELAELDEQLESARSQLSEKEAQELKEVDGSEGSAKDGIRANDGAIQQLDEYINKQKKHYEHQLDRFGEELTELESINEGLVKENSALWLELSESRELVKNLKVNSHLLSEKLEEVSSANLELNLQLAKAESESQVQQKLLKKSHDEDEVLISAFNDKLESLKRAIEFRDEEIRRLKSDNQFTLESFGMKLNEDSIYDKNDIESNMSYGNLIDSDNKQRVIDIARAFKDKDSQIELLKGQLLQATKDLERNASYIEKLIKSQSESGFDTSSTILNGNSLDQQPEYKMLEKELETKDRQLHLLEFKIHHYETVLPNMISNLIQELAVNSGSANKLSEPNILKKIEDLTDSLNKLLSELSFSQQLLDNINHLRSLNEVKSAQIERLVNDLNQLDAKFSLVQQQCDLLQIQKSRVDFTKDKAMNENEQQQAVASEDLVSQQNGASEQVKSDLEKKKVTFMETVNKQISSDCPTQLDKASHSPLVHQSIKMNSTSKEKAIESQLPINLKESTTNVDLGLERNNSTRAHLTDYNSDNQSVSESKRSIRKLAQPSIKVAQSLSMSRVMSTGGTSIDTALSQQIRLRQLESENQLLELAMKEILLSIKWSDAQCSTILIDCPSLERLCQIIEAKFLAKSTAQQQVNNGNTIGGTSSDEGLSIFSNADLFQMIVLKSELDLLRGQNEQLRVDVKIHRREYNDLLKKTLNNLSSEGSVNSQYSQKETDQGLPVDLKSKRTESRNEALIGEKEERSCEVECQTESIEMISLDQINLAGDSTTTTTTSSLKEDTKKCQNCAKLANLTNHLLQCIIRVETRVNVSEETYVNRLINLHQLIQMLDKEITTRDRLLNDSRQESHLLMQQKIIAESQLQFLEGQWVAHMNACYLTHLTTGTNAGRQAINNLQVYRAAKNGNGESIESLTISKGGDQQAAIELPLRSARLTITILQSIIGCLQARIDYKDDRLNQLESLLSGNNDIPMPIPTNKVISEQKLVKVR